eukprot:3658668-Rhodomonas_salina.1
MASESDLQLIEGPLLGKMWPPERIVVGLRCCKWLRENLIEHAVSHSGRERVVPCPNGSKHIVGHCTVERCRFEQQHRHLSSQADPGNSQLSVSSYVLCVSVGPAYTTLLAPSPPPFV